MSRYSYEERLSIIRHAVHLCTWLLATSFPVVATHFHFIELIIHCTTIVNVGLCKEKIKLIINHNMIEFSLSLLMSVNVFKFLCRYKALFVICILIITVLNVCMHSLQLWASLEIMYIVLILLSEGCVTTIAFGLY